MLRDVRLWLAPPVAAREASPSLPSTSSATPVHVSGSEGDASGAASVAGYQPPPQQPAESSMRIPTSESGSSDTEVRVPCIARASSAKC